VGGVKYQLKKEFEVELVVWQVTCERHLLTQYTSPGSNLGVHTQEAVMGKLIVKI